MQVEGFVHYLYLFGLRASTGYPPCFLHKPGNLRQFASTRSYPCFYNFPAIKDQRLKSEAFSSFLFNCFFLPSMVELAPEAVIRAYLVPIGGRSKIGRIFLVEMLFHDLLIQFNT